MEAAVVQGLPVYAVRTLYQAVDFFQGTGELSPEKIELSKIYKNHPRSGIDFSDVMGQEHVKRAMEVAAAGSHNLLMTGPPGSGKTMMARRIPTILPDLSFNEAIEITKIFSVTGMMKKDQALITERPFRTPHHTISDAGLIGGGHVPRPGEVSLAHNGVLFLDELPEFKKHVLEVLRQPLEDQYVTISRAALKITYPSNFMLVGAMNPCPCGYFSDSKRECRCTHQQIHRYRSRISGPLLDRIDIHIEVPAVHHQDLMRECSAEPSKNIQKRVADARSIQSKRFEKLKIYSNSRMNSRAVRCFCRTDRESQQLLETAIDRLGLSARAYTRILKIARTIADLEAEPDILTDHIAEAIQYRSLDRRV
jgi:magnesium chelatase family protein